MKIRGAISATILKIGKHKDRDPWPSSVRAPFEGGIIYTSVPNIMKVIESLFLNKL